MNTRIDHGLVGARHARERLGILTGNDFDDFLEGVELVTRVDALRRITRA